jgi:integrase
MASIHRKTGASGEQSPFWQAKFRGLDGKVIWLTTKQEDSRKAHAVAGKWEEAVQLAEKWELTQIKTQKILADIAELTKTTWSGAQTVAITAKFLNGLLAKTIGEELAGQNFAKFCAEWLKDKKNARATAQSTLNRYEGIVNRFLAYLPEKRQKASVGSISTGEIERFRNSEIEAGKTPGTANLGMRVLRAIFNDARRQGIIASNPAEAARILTEEPEERKPFDEDQVKALLREADQEWKGAILIAYHAGARLSDCADLSWDSYDPVNHRLSFRPKKTGKRTRKNTVIALHADIVNYLDSLPVSDVPGQKLFPGLSGRASGGHAGLSNAFNRLMAKAGIRVQVGVEKQGKGRQFKLQGFHALRHSFVSRLANADVSADIRKELVGHSSDEIHRRYVHLDSSLQEKAIGKLSSVL